VPKLPVVQLGMEIATPMNRTLAALRARPRDIYLPGAVTMGSRLFWAMLWVIGIPLPILFILYMLFGGS
jgi:hypothetical protein